MYQNLPTQINPRMPKRLPHSLGFARYALSFDGVDDYVDAGTDASLDITGGLTLEVRVNINVRSAFHGIAGSGPHLGGAYYLFQRNAPGHDLAFVVNPDGTFRSITFGTYVVNKWHHIVGIWDGTNIKAYLDGVEYTPLPFVDSVARRFDPFLIGYNHGLSPGFFNGLIGEVRIYNRALSAEERRWNMLNYHNPIRSGLVLWLPMEEGAGEIVYDKSGKGNHGTLLPAGAGPTWQRLRQWELRAAVE